MIRPGESVIEAWDRISREAEEANLRLEPPLGGVVEAGDFTSYVAKVCDGVATAAVGTRNDTLNAASYTLGRVIAAGQIDEQATAWALTQAGKAAGLDDGEVQGTVHSGVTAGMEHPRALSVTTAPSPSVVEAAQPGETHEDTVRRLFPALDWHALWADENEEEWILEPLLPARRLIALFSAPKVGKSLLMLELAVAIATGRPALGVTIDRPRRVLYIDFENDPLGDIRARLTAMGHTPGDLGNLVYLSYPNLAALDSEKGSLELMAAVEVYGCEVIVIDTISRAVAGEENDNDTWLSFYRHTGLKLKQAGVAMIRLDHSGKDETRGQRGGSAKSGDVDAVWRMTQISDDTFRLDLISQRMPIAEKMLVLTRHPTPHLHHQVAGEPRAAAMEAGIAAVLDLCRTLHLPLDISRPEMRKHLQATGIRTSNVAIGEALKRRRLWPQELSEMPVLWNRGQAPENSLSQDSGDRPGQEPKE